MVLIFYSSRIINSNNKKTKNRIKTIYIYKKNHIITEKTTRKRIYSGVLPSVLVKYCFIVCIFDLYESTVPPSPSELITDNQIEIGQLKAELKDKVMYTLLRRHRHQTKKSNLRSLADIGKTVSSASRLFSNPENGKTDASLVQSFYFLLLISTGEKTKHTSYKFRCGSHITGFNSPLTSHKYISPLCKS